MVLKAPKLAKYRIKPKRNYYDTLEIDEFRTYVGKNRNKIRLIYVCDCPSGEMVAFVRGKRDLKTALKSQARINRSGITYDRIVTDGGTISLPRLGETP